jgi:hypothetical protein
MVYIFYFARQCERQYDITSHVYPILESISDTLICVFMCCIAYCVEQWQIS